MFKGAIDRDRDMSGQQKGRRDIGEYPLTTKIIVHLQRYLEYFVYLQQFIPDLSHCENIKGIRDFKLHPPCPILLAGNCLSVYITL